jgi:ABC-type phosphate/phosphonate transport system substrate-binding protein
MTDVPRPLLIGAVAYDPKVVTIWEGFKRVFGDRGLEIDYVLYSNYERQVEALMRGDIDVAWNSPLAWVRTRRLARAAGREVRAVAMRDADRDLTSIVVVRAESDLRSVEDLRDRKLGVGAIDSPQATLLPLSAVDQAGIDPDRDVEVIVHDLFAGKHGDHGAAERAAAKALDAGELDAICILGSNGAVFAEEGVWAPGSVRVIAETAAFDHCNFTATDAAPADAVARFRELLLAMDYDDPEVRPLCELEGLRSWVDGRVERYVDLERAVDRFGFYDETGAVTARAYRY